MVSTTVLLDTPPPQKKKTVAKHCLRPQTSKCLRRGLRPDTSGNMKRGVKKGPCGPLCWGVWSSMCWAPASCWRSRGCSWRRTRRASFFLLLGAIAGCAGFVAVHAVSLFLVLPRATYGRTSRCGTAAAGSRGSTASSGWPVWAPSVSIPRCWAGLACWRWAWLDSISDEGFGRGDGNRCHSCFCMPLLQSHRKISNHKKYPLTLSPLYPGRRDRVAPRLRIVDPKLGFIQNTGKGVLALTKVERNSSVLSRIPHGGLGASVLHSVHGKSTAECTECPCRVQSARRTVHAVFFHH